MARVGLGDENIAICSLRPIRGWELGLVTGSGIGLYRTKGESTGTASQIVDFRLTGTTGDVLEAYAVALVATTMVRPR